MAKETSLSTESVNAEADALAALCNNGYIRIYDGTKPATADTAIGAQTLLAELRFGATAFGAAVAGVLTANAITQDSSANDTGTASWCRILKSDGTSEVMDGTVGTSDANLIVSTTAISATVAVSCSSFTHTVAKETSGS